MRILLDILAHISHAPPHPVLSANRLHCDKRSKESCGIFRSLLYSCMSALSGWGAGVESGFEFGWVDGCGCDLGCAAGGAPQTP